jgi:coproporphyrinogen III oxidase
MFVNTDISESFKLIQDEICSALELCDGGGVFVEDLWERPGGGGGRTRIFRNGNVIEKGGVNFSAVYGDCSNALKQQMHTKAATFFATGVSIVLHPNNPHVPIIHMNIRHFALSDGTSWYGGGIDLTPHYIVKEQATWFHGQLKSVCDSYSSDYYPKFKSWADDYFFLPHRNETRGIGGVFFDDLGRNDNRSEVYRDFVLAIGRSFAPIYTHLMDLNRDKSYTTEERLWQQLRRGRYVEFNLVHDRGTRFGLLTNGRTESILMSLPSTASWEYDFQTKAGSREEETLEMLVKGMDWLE